MLTSAISDADSVSITKKTVFNGTFFCMLNGISIMLGLTQSWFVFSYSNMAII